MTSLAAALGMMPLAWAFGSGADMLRPLVIAVIGGLYEQQQIAFRGLTVQRLSRGRRAATAGARTGGEDMIFSQQSCSFFCCCFFFTKVSASLLQCCSSRYSQ